MELPNVGDYVRAYHMFPESENGAVGVAEDMIFEGLKGGKWEVYGESGKAYEVNEWHLFRAARVDSQPKVD